MFHTNDKVFIIGKFSLIDIQLAAILSKDEEMLKLLEKGETIYAEIAELIFETSSINLNQ